MPVIPALGKWGQDNHEFKANVGYLGSSRPVWAVRLKKKKKKKEVVLPDLFWSLRVISCRKC
jgi:hypothetical protein